MPDQAATFSAVLLVLLVAHQVADHWVQTDAQALAKGLTGADSWTGRLAAARHVATYTVTAGLLLGLVWWLLALHLVPGRVAAGLALNAALHWVIDRGWTLRWAAARIPGKARFVNLGGPLGGGYLLDQSAHWACLLAAALVMARV